MDTRKHKPFDDPILRAAKRGCQARSRAQVRNGRTAESQFLFPPELVRTLKFRFRSNDY